jgi:DNA invertase Pin-like site-specific DNA recombinase
MPQGYSYRRWSSEQQASGDTLRRQTEAAEAWCLRNGVTLNTSLNMIDAGVPAFHGGNLANPDVHALAGFMQAVKQGRVAKGSYLIVESFDRLSREEVRLALPRILDLINASIRIVQLRPETVLDEKSDNIAMIQLILTLARGHEESATKSYRVAEAWDRKRATAATKPLTRRVPGWLHMDPSGKIEPIPERVEIVLRIYHLAIGGQGVSRIAEQLNRDGVPPFGRSPKWASGVVHHILTTRSVLGEFQPHKGLKANSRKGRPKTIVAVGEPIRNYFPKVVPPEVFYAAADGIRRRSRAVPAEGGPARQGSGASKSERINLFAGLLKDAHDGGSFSYRQPKNKPNRQPALVPVGAITGRGSPWSSFPAGVFEKALLARLPELKASDVFPDVKEGDRVAALSGRVQEAADQIARLKRKMDEKPELLETLADTIAEWVQRRRALAAELAEAQQEVANPISQAWGDFRSLTELAESGNDEARLRIRAALRRTIDAVWCWFGRAELNGIARRVAVVQVNFQGGARRYCSVEYKAAGRGRKEQWSATAWRDRGIDLSDPTQLDRIGSMIDLDGDC